MKNPQRKKNIIFVLLFAVLMLPVVSVINVQAAFSQDDLKVMKNVLVDHGELFKKNDIVMGAFRHVGWGITKFMANLASSAADLFDTCFGFIDFTTWPKVSNYIAKWKVVWGAVLSLSLLATGIIIMVWNEKRPKIFVNIVLAIFVISCSTYLLSEMNKFLGTDVRKEILGTNNSAGVVYETLGTNIHDLVYLDKKYGLKNLNQKTSDGAVKAAATYNNMTEKQMNEINITQVFFPDLVSSDSKFISEYEMIAYPSNFSKSSEKKESNSNNSGLSGNLANNVVTQENLNQAKDAIPNSIKIDDTTYIAEELYDGLAWTDAFNTYYYRYTVDYFTANATMLSLVLVYVLMAFKVVKVIYENVIKEIVAIVQSANITQNQKTIKCLQSLRDGYIVLLLTLVTIKIYLLASKYISNIMPNGQEYKGWLMIFIAFAVIEGPNIIMQLTGMDAGSSDGASKIMSAYYGISAAAGMTKMATGAVRKMGGGIKNVGGRIKGAAAKAENKENMEAMKKATGKSSEGAGKEKPQQDNSQGKVPPKGAGNKETGNKGSSVNEKNAVNNGGNSNNSNGRPEEMNNENAKVPPKDGQASNMDKDNKASSDIKDQSPKDNKAASDIKGKEDKGKKPVENATAGQKNDMPKGVHNKAGSKSNSVKSMDAMKQELSGGGGKINIDDESANKPLEASPSSFNFETNNNNTTVMQDMKQSLRTSENSKEKE